MIRGIPDSEDVISYLRRQHRYLDVGEVAHRLRMNQVNVREMCRKGILGARKIGHRWRIDSTWLADWLAKDQSRSVVRKGSNHKKTVSKRIGQRSGHVSQ